MAINDVLPLKTTRRDAIDNLKYFWASEHHDLISMVSVTFAMYIWRTKGKEKFCITTPHADGDLEEEMKWVNWEGWCRWQKEGGPEQSLVERHKNRYGEKRNYFRISRGKDERTDKILTSQGQ